MDSGKTAFDIERALAAVEGDADLLVAKAQQFLEENPGRLDEMREAIERRDLDALERLARGLAGTAEKFCAEDTERAARALMERAASGDVPALRTLLERAEAALSDLTDELAVHCTRHELRNVLIADQDDATRLRLEHLLNRWGHRVTSVSRGDVALEILGPSGPPHLAIVDATLPGMSGIDVCNAIRARKADTYTYVILLTERDDAESMLAGLEAGADDFLLKPIAPEELRARLRAGQRIVELQERLISAREEQRRYADRDGLTGVSSHRHVFEVLDTSLSESAAQSTDLTIALIDLDDFKRVNDEHGNIVGDRALRLACDAMQRQLRRTDVFGRCGGDEFVAVLPETSGRDGVVIAKRMCDALASAPLECGEIALRATASVGIATTNGVPCERDQFLKWADRALSTAKAAGGNQVVKAESDACDGDS